MKQSDFRTLADTELEIVCGGNKGDDAARTTGSTGNIEQNATTDNYPESHA